MIVGWLTLPFDIVLDLADIISRVSTWLGERYAGLIAGSRHWHGLEGIE